MPDQVVVRRGGDVHRADDLNAAGSALALVDAGGAGLLGLRVGEGGVSGRVMPVIVRVVRVWVEQSVGLVVRVTVMAVVWPGVVSLSRGRPGRGGGRRERTATR
ncbi:hypothetical protein [Pseudofrankia asymbiotica]|uniref:Uncharacterized protein n=1 Tax=Pseudofrankia asymbiotica TaxID=1834516 RepID=A0A1V2ILM4_9ACTN|nr:hypothetical protein [Pseudofrankia asymbiotica]ONH33925.1 hypothetical protein BL253_00040 [Pseudofrankia asymbiotica]